MSTLSKVFIILVLVAALVTAGIVATLFAQRVDWKDKFTREVNHHYQALQVKNAEIAARDLEIENRNTVISILNEKINTIDTENSAKAERIRELNKSLDDSRTAMQKLTADQEVLVRQIEVQLAQTQELNVKVDEYRAKLGRALNEKSTAVSELQNSRQLAERLQQDLAELEAKHVDTARDKKQLEERINHLNELGVKTDVAPKKPLEGKVTAVSVEFGLVVISIGREAGVLEGDEFTIYRGGDFVAKMTIDKVDRGWAAGKVVLKKLDPNRGDDVSNHIIVSAPKPSAGP